MAEYMYLICIKETSGFKSQKKFLGAAITTGRSLLMMVMMNFVLIK